MKDELLIINHHIGPLPYIYGVFELKSSHTTTILFFISHFQLGCY